MQDFDKVEIHSNDTDNNNILGLVQRHPFPEKTCPPQESYSWRGLASLPKRLLFPPPLTTSTHDLEADLGAPRKFKRSQSTSTTTSGSLVPRWLTQPPTHLIVLSDVIRNKHFSPLTARDFKDYLIHDELTPENLYFYHWLESYTSLFEKESDRGDGRKVELQTPSTQLQHQFTLGLESFFSQGLFELNLSGKMKQKVMMEAMSSFEPSIFDDVKAEVMRMLESSMQQWLSKQCGNASHNRQIFGFTLGFIVMAIALTIELVLLFFSHSRAARIGPSALVWFGVMLELQCARSTCPIIFAFGNFRQLHPWELMRLHDKTSSIRMERIDLCSEKSIDQRSSSGCGSDEWILAQQINQSTPVFSPVTKIESPLMARILRYNIVSGASWAIPAALIWALIWIPLPVTSR